MSVTQIQTSGITNDAVTNAKIANNAVGTTQIANDAVTNAKIANNAVGTTQIANDAVTTAKINFETALVPIGGIIMWSGTGATIPTGWALCNGENGTPNLRNRFIVGAGGRYSSGDTGGSSHAVVVSHSHGIEDPGHTHTITAALVTRDARAGDGDNEAVNQTLTTDSSVTGISINSAGEDGTNKNLPPYYALAFIMRVS